MSVEAVAVAGGDLAFLADARRALFWPKADTLFVADVHLNKAGVMRRAGLAIPDTHAGDLAILTALLRDHAARRLIVLGDLFHARPGAGDRQLREAFGAWRDACPDVEMILVRGNHDRNADDDASAWGIDAVVPTLTLDGLRLCHEPDAGVPGAYTLAGHLHPVATLRGPGRDRLRAPCFWFGVRTGVLPSFGRLTGGFPIRARAEDQVLVALEGGLQRLA